MAQGKYPPQARLRFRAEYLLTNSPYRARNNMANDPDCEWPISQGTATAWAKELREDQEFRAEQKAITDDYLGELVAARMRIARTAEDRFMGPQEGEVDNRPQYARVVIDAERNAHYLAKLITPDVSTPNVTINVTGPAKVEPEAEG